MGSLRAREEEEEEEKKEEGCGSAPRGNAAGLKASLPCPSLPQPPPRASPIIITLKCLPSPLVKVELFVSVASGAGATARRGYESGVASELSSSSFWLCF